jgi:hypothetical protein
MLGLIIKVIFGLFIWQGLPRLIFIKRKSKSGSAQGIVTSLCKVIGIVIIAIAIFDYIR